MEGESFPSGGHFHTVRTEKGAPDSSLGRPGRLNFCNTTVATLGWAKLGCTSLGEGEIWFLCIFGLLRSWWKNICRSLWPVGDRRAMPQPPSVQVTFVPVFRRCLKPTQREEFLNCPLAHPQIKPA
ncbi:hypothetical protein E2320_004394, partial [Naja naja]